MSFLKQTIYYTVLIALTASCGSKVSFKGSGDENASDVIPPDVPCVGADCPPDDDDTTTSRAEVFFQTPRDAKVDILFVDDNSGSMEVEQSLLGSKFNTFISSLADLDWQIGITTTDVSNGQYGQKGALLPLFNNPNKKILVPGFPNANNVFKKTIERPETIGCGGASCPSGVEQPLYATILALEKRRNENNGFFRDGSDLAVVVLSDEDEMSNRPSAATKPQNVVDKFKSIWGREKKLSFYGIVIKPNDQACLDLQIRQSGSTGDYGTAVAELAQLTGGTLGSICDADYSASLRSIGEKVRELLYSFELDKTPIAGTVRVKLTPAQTIAWRVEGNKLIFAQAPSLGTKIDVTYDHR